MWVEDSLVYNRLHTLLARSVFCHAEVDGFLKEALAYLVISRVDKSTAKVAKVVYVR